MPTDADFLTAIAATPADRLPRLVYADWLDERGDVRGELIRIEEETRERVAWDETLWRLKPRRNELRRQVDADWLKAMDYGQTCEPLFRGQPFPTDVKAAWRLIREAHERWKNVPMPDVGGHPDKIEEAEKRLGVTLPPSVREHIAFAHDLPQEEPHWRLIYRDHYMMEVIPGQTALGVLQLWEGDVFWGIRFQDLSLEDPPVYTYRLQPDPTEEAESAVFVPSDEPPFPSLTQFVLAHMYAYVTRRGRTGQMSVGVQDVEQTRTRLKRDLPFQTAFNGSTLYEATNYTATFAVPGYHDPGYVTVHTYRPVVEAEMPECVREWFRAGAGYNGVFGDLRYGYVRGVPSGTTPIEYSPPPPPSDLPATGEIPPPHLPTPEEPWPDDIPF